MSPIEKNPKRLGRPPKGERHDTRQELLDAALELFAEQGYAGTSVKEIAEVVGIRDSAIYRHFQGKREIFEQLVAESGPVLLDELEIPFEQLPERHPREVLPRLFGRLMEAWDRPRPRRMISMLMREGLPGVPEVLDGVRERFHGPFERWRERAWLRTDVPTDQLV